MKRSFHVVCVFYGNSGKHETVLGSFDTYEQAKAFGVSEYSKGLDGQQFQIHNGGAIVWGPYLVGGKYKP